MKTKFALSIMEQNFKVFERHYYDIHTALLNAFLNDNYAILILEGYMMVLVKQTDNFYLFDSHARDICGMPDLHTNYFFFPI